MILMLNLLLELEGNFNYVIFKYNKKVIIMLYFKFKILKVIKNAIYHVIFFMYNLFHSYLLDMERYI